MATAEHCAAARLNMLMSVQASKYGRDPRQSPQLDDNLGMVNAALNVKAAWTPGVVGSLDSVTQLSLAIRDANTQRGFVCLKFWREGCKACAGTKEKFEEAAAQYPHGQFFLVNYNKARDLCRQCGLGVVPAGHIYSSGSLQAALSLGPSSWDAFAERIRLVWEETQTGQVGTLGDECN
eukprot:CAMPEP_0119299570 /NCGR_PEP_ID=MMETSP1333-20130426/1644_1 /TAXON_ID=418940 /ORGANISM="Scyphosphaera apsteinii, Strain RCC1455" /LENGTH=178 /DNA_ID=CAMNT_0007301039 /DNA_START=55 /DNA_END=592 /DNA_ORIENTATION=+